MSIDTLAAAGRGDMRAQGISSNTCSSRATSGLVTVKETLRRLPPGTGKARTS